MKKTIYILLAVTLLISCKSRIQYVPIETIKIEYRDRFLRDSVMQYDSIYIKDKGDTIRIEKYKYLYRDKIVRDSIFLTDTINVPYPVEKQLTKWQQRKMDLGGWAMGAFSGVILIVIGWVIVWLIRKKKK